MTIRILIIEDDALWAAALKSIYTEACRTALKLKRVSFETADSFAAASEALSGNRKFDLVSLDLSLSEPDGVFRSGLGLLRHFRGRDPAISGLIVVTGAGYEVRKQLHASVRNALRRTSVQWELCENKANAPNERSTADLQLNIEVILERLAERGLRKRIARGQIRRVRVGWKAHSRQKGPDYWVEFVFVDPADGTNRRTTIKRSADETTHLNEFRLFIELVTKSEDPNFTGLVMPHQQARAIHDWLWTECTSLKNFNIIGPVRDPAAIKPPRKSGRYRILSENQPTCGERIPRRRLFDVDQENAIVDSPDGAAADSDDGS